MPDMFAVIDRPVAGATGLVADLTAALTEVGEHRRAVHTPGFVWLSWFDGLEVQGMREYLADRFTDLSGATGHLEISNADGESIYLNRVLRPATAVLALLRSPQTSVRDLFVERRLPARGLTPATAEEAIAIDVVLDRHHGEPTGDVTMVRQVHDIIGRLGGPSGVLAVARRTLYR